MNPPAPQPIPWHPVAAIAAWIVPGLGHIILGQVLRGFILFFTIAGLMVGGVFIGGIDVFDRSKHPIVYFSQAAIAPSIPATLMIQAKKVSTSDFAPDNHPPYTPALGKSEEQGSLFTGVAGLLNMLAIMDAFYREPRRKQKHGRPEPQPPTPVPPSSNAIPPEPSPAPVPEA